MSRRISALAALVVVAIVFVSACSSSATGPAPLRADQTCDYASNPTCHR